MMDNYDHGLQDHVQQKKGFNGLNITYISMNRVKNENK